MSQRGTGISWLDALMALACVVALAIVLHGMISQIQDLQRRVGHSEQVIKQLESERR